MRTMLEPSRSIHVRHTQTVSHALHRPVAPSGNTIRRESGPKRLSSDVLTYTPIDDAPPPAYSNTYGRVDIVQDDLSTVANVSSG